MKPKRPLQPTRPNLKPRKAKLKLPTLAAFKKLPLIERTKVFARWADTKRGRYDFGDIFNCPLAQLGKAISDSTKSANDNSIRFRDHRLVEVFPAESNVLITDPRTFPALTKRLKAHIAAQS